MIRHNKWYRLSSRCSVLWRMGHFVRPFVHVSFMRLWHFSFFWVRMCVYAYVCVCVCMCSLSFISFGCVCWRYVWYAYHLMWNRWQWQKAFIQTNNSKQCLPLFFFSIVRLFLFWFGFLLQIWTFYKQAENSMAKDGKKMDKTTISNDSTFFVCLFVLVLVTWQTYNQYRDTDEE